MNLTSIYHRTCTNLPCASCQDMLMSASYVFFPKSTSTHTHRSFPHFPTWYAKFYLSETNLNQTPHRNCKSRNNKSPTKNILPPKNACCFSKVLNANLPGEVWSRSCPKSLFWRIYAENFVQDTKPPFFSRAEIAEITKWPQLLRYLGSS